LVTILLLADRPGFFSVALQTPQTLTACFSSPRITLVLRAARDTFCAGRDFFSIST